MSIFDPFDPARPLESSGCLCGRHRSQAEHDFETRLTLQCAPFESAPMRVEKRYAGVIAAGAMRATFGRPPRA